MRALLLVCLLLASASSLATPAKWQHYKSAGSTSVEYRRGNDGILQISAQTEVKSAIGAMLHLLEDTANIRNWVANSEKAELLDHPDNHTHLVHTYFSAIWPVSKRDMVTKSVWQQDANSGVLSMTVTDMGQHYPPVKGYVRMEQVRGEWTLTPKPDGMLSIRYQGQADPAGKIPHFIADKVALNAMWSSFKQLANVLANYQQPYPGIAEQK